MSLRFKAYVYLTFETRLLVFSMPDYPHIGLEVPGGTLDLGESFMIAARREFAEETGLPPLGALEWLCDQDYLFDNELGRDLHRRRLFHARAGHMPTGSIPASDWEHFEMTPNAGGDPVRFRLFWADLFDERLDTGMAYAFEVPLFALRRKMSAEQPVPHNRTANFSKHAIREHA